jgi:GNAT superfamily N-acetyltransferase
MRKFLERRMLVRPQLSLCRAVSDDQRIQAARQQKTLLRHVPHVSDQAAPDSSSTRGRAQFQSSGNLVTLRQANTADVPAMHRVRLAVRENTLSDPARITEEDYLAALDELGRTWVVETDGEIAAFATGYRAGSIWALFVHPDHEGCGYGKALLAKVVDWLWSLGHQRIWLSTASGTRAQRFYVAQGWQLRDAVSGGDIRLELDAP